MQNFLYCNNAPKAGSECTTGDAGSAAVDLINYHFYAVAVTPETIYTSYFPSSTSFLRAADKLKPVISGEGSWGLLTVAGNIWKNDAYARAGFIPRYFALNWSSGIATNMWYSYEGTLYDRGTSMLDQPEGQAYIVTRDWLLGAVPDHTPFCEASGTIYTCDLKRANGHIAQLVWDSKYGQSCPASQTGGSIICGATSYTVPSQYTSDWVDLSGAVHAYAAQVTIGANPILLEGP